MDNNFSVEEIKKRITKDKNGISNYANVYIDEMDWLVKQAEIINSIKDFCESEANIYTDLAKKNPHNLKRISFNGKEQAFISIINHIKNLEQS